LKIPDDRLSGFKRPVGRVLSLAALGWRCSSSLLRARRWRRGWRSSFLRLGLRKREALNMEDALLQESFKEMATIGEDIIDPATDRLAGGVLQLKDLQISLLLIHHHQRKTLEAKQLSENIIP